MKNNITVKRIIGLFLALCLIIGCCGCSNTATITPVTPGSEGAQYVIALNPSLGFDDTTVSSIRNNTASSLQADVTSGKAESLYNTPWRWQRRADDGNWHVRKLRSVSVWRDSSSTQRNGAPYSYTVTDSGISSLAVFDNKMDVKGVKEGELPESGVIMSFTGKEEEALTYFVDKDCYAELSDRNGGNVAIVSSIAGVNTDFTKVKGANKALVVRIYKNNRIYWQEVLDSETTAVSFPTFSNLELKMDDAISITVQAMDDTSGIIRGNCDLPATTATIIEKIPVETQVEVGKKPATAIPFVNDNIGMSNFIIVAPADISESGNNVVNKLRTGMQNALGVDVDVTDDSMNVEGNKIWVYKTKFDASKSALTEIQKNRKNNVADFIIRVIENDIIIVADTEIGLDLAVEFFVNNYCKSADSEIPLKHNYISSNFNPIKNITLAGNSIFDYRVVISSAPSLIEVQAANELVKQIARLSGKIIPVVRDGESAANGKEILVGNTNRKNYNGVADYANAAYNNADAKFKISVEDKYTSVLGSHIYGVSAGVLKFVETLEKTPTLKKGYSLEGQYDGEYSLVDGYKLTWADDFDADKLSSYWRAAHHLGDVRDNHYGGKTYNVKPTFRDGAMVQYVKKEGNTIYESEIDSKGVNEMNFMWGYIEQRVKFAVTPGVCGALWTKANVTGGFLESDIYENFGNLDSLAHQFHIWGNDDARTNIITSSDRAVTNYKPGTTTKEPFGVKYHTIGWEWTDNYSTFYVDGRPTVTFDSSTDVAYDVFDKPAWLLVQTTAATDIYGTSLPVDFTYDEMCVDYIHIYQKQNDGSIMYVKNKG